MAFISSLPLTGSSVIASFHPSTSLDLQQIAESSIHSYAWSPISAQELGRSLTPLMLSCIAGASTSLGALVVFIVPKDGENGSSHVNRQRFLDRFLCFSLSLAASVMITVSVISILPESLEGVLQCDYNGGYCNLLRPVQLGQRFLGFGIGCFLYVFLGMAIDSLPEPNSIFPDNKSYIDDHETAMTESQVNISIPHSDRTILTFLEDDMEAECQRRTSAWNLAMLVFVSLLLHNAPEGFAVAASAAESHQLGLVVTIGIMLHNIPEGLAIAVPCIVAAPDRPWFAFTMATISGLAEPIGALLALQLLQMDSAMALPMGNVLAAVAGIMCMVSIRDLYPAAINHAPTIFSQESIKRDYSWLLVGSCLGTAIMSGTEFLLMPR